MTSLPSTLVRAPQDRLRALALWWLRPLPLVILLSAGMLILAFVPTLAPRHVGASIRTYSISARGIPFEDGWGMPVKETPVAQLQVSRSQSLNVLAPCIRVYEESAEWTWLSPAEPSAALTDEQRTALKRRVANRLNDEIVAAPSSCVRRSIDWSYVPVSLQQLVGFLAIVSALIGLLICGVFSPALKTAHRQRDGLCPECAYDLRHDFASGCPECGWNRAAS